MVTVNFQLGYERLQWRRYGTKIKPASRIAEVPDGY
jgi:hypothetical protein